jgi:hypothetical protein
MFFVRVTRIYVIQSGGSLYIWMGWFYIRGLHPGTTLSHELFTWLVCVQSYTWIPMALFLLWEILRLGGNLDGDLLGRLQAILFSSFTLSPSF